MRIYSRLAAGTAILFMLSAGTVMGEDKAPCNKAKPPETVEGHVAKIDMNKGIVIVRESDGTMQEFQASKETLQDFKVGDPIKAKLREAAKC